MRYSILILQLIFFAHLSFASTFRIHNDIDTQCRFFDRDSLVSTVQGCSHTPDGGLICADENEYCWAGASSIKDGCSPWEDSNPRDDDDDSDSGTPDDDTNPGIDNDTGGDDGNSGGNDGSTGGTDDSANGNDNDVGGDENDRGNDDDDHGNDDDTGGNDNDTGGNDNDTGGNDNDAGGNDDDAGGNDDDTGSDWDDDFRCTEGSSTGSSDGPCGGRSTSRDNDRLIPIRIDCSHPSVTCDPDIGDGNTFDEVEDYIAGRKRRISITCDSPFVTCRKPRLEPKYSDNSKFFNGVTLDCSNPFVTCDPKYKGLPCSMDYEEKKATDKGAECDGQNFCLKDQLKKPNKGFCNVEDDGIFCVKPDEPETETETESEDDEDCIQVEGRMICLDIDPVEPKLADCIEIAGRRVCNNIKPEPECDLRLGGKCFDDEFENPIEPGLGSPLLDKYKSDRADRLNKFSKAGNLFLKSSSLSSTPLIFRRDIPK